MSAYNKPKFDPQKLDILIELRQKAKVSQGQAAEFFKMSDYGSIANWESGRSKPWGRRRPDFIIYLVDKLGLRHDYQQFLNVWNAVMVEEWLWEPLTDSELQHAFPGHNATTQPFSPAQLTQLEAIAGQGADLAQLASLVIGQTDPATKVIWAIAPGDTPAKRLANGITFHSLYLIAIPDSLQ
ncbi:MAG: helix-turn-helix transcriptional regulator [Anaerolineae bacterium]|nr:helix-turn-helix transcriptional regulator [Anaerolineae bacterium]